VLLKHVLRAQDVHAVDPYVSQRGEAAEAKKVRPGPIGTSGELAAPPPVVPVEVDRIVEGP
jgi:hypothetical protein